MGLVHVFCIHISYKFYIFLYNFHILLLYSIFYNCVHIKINAMGGVSNFFHFKIDAWGLPRRNLINSLGVDGRGSLINNYRLLMGGAKHVLITGLCLPLLNSLSLCQFYHLCSNSQMQVKSNCCYICFLACNTLKVSYFGLWL